MDIINYIKNANIEGISILKLKDMLKDSNLQNPLILPDSNGNNVFIKCIREYYKDPSTGKKMKKVNVANECNVIRRTFGINNVSQFACASCHRKILEQHFAGKIDIINSSKR